MFITVLTHISALSILLPFVFSLRNFKAFDSVLKALFILVSVSLLTELYGFLYFLHKWNTVPVFFVYTIIEGLLLSYMFYKVFSSSIIQAIVKGLSFLYIITAAFISIFHWSHEILTGMESTLVILYSAYYFYSLFQVPTGPDITKLYFFWINSAFFFYFGTNLFLFIFENSLRYSNPFILNFSWSIHLFSNIISHTLITVGICKIKTK